MRDHLHPDEFLDERIIFPVSKRLAREIADYRFENRIDSKSEAIRRLIEAGLKAEARRSKR